MSSIHLARRGYISATAPGDLSRMRFTSGNPAVFLMTASGSSGATGSTTILDSSSANATVSRFGDVVQCGFSPFGSEYPGSIYFDGTAQDYITVPDRADYGFAENENFTIEAWVYLTATPGVQTGQIWGRQEFGLNSNYVMAINSSRQLNIYINNVGNYITNTTVLNLNQWYHVAVARNGTGSNNLTLYVNGVGQSSTTNVSSSGAASGVWTVGADQAGDESRFTGFISNVRYVKGTAVYTANFTPPTEPLTAVSGTQLLLKGSNFTGVADIGTGGFPMTVYGNANLSTAQKKYGPTSLSLDGTGDGILLRLSQNTTTFNFGTGTFTFKAWVYNTNYNATQGSTIIGAHEVGTATNFFFGLNTAGRLHFLAGATSVTAPSGLPQNQWVHVAAVRTLDGTVTLYQDGVSVASGSITASIANASYAVTIGVDNAGDEGTFTGFIADVSISKVAEYIADYTVPATTATSFVSGAGVVTNSVYGVYRLP